MNPIGYTVLGAFGGLMALVMVVLALPYLAPYAGSASTGVTSTGTLYTNLLPFIGAIIGGGLALLGLDMVRKR